MQKIAIAGFGIEGRANYAYFKDKGEITIVDERETLDDAPSGVPTILGPGALTKLQGFDLVVRTAGLNPNKIVTQGKVWSATNEFFAQCPVPIIGVTGTKGKGTTSSLIASILEAAGKAVHLVGNIGTPALEALPNIKPDDIVVYELSSFQLWDLEKSPHIAVMLPIEPDHLDVHQSFNEYVLAKSNITRYQTPDDTLVYHAGDKVLQFIARLTKANAVPYPFDIAQVADSLTLPGQHNVENAAAAIAAVREYSVADDDIRQGLAAFEGLPHRLKFVAEKNGVKYYDDSIATTPGSAIAAIKSFDARITLIIGGVDKGGDPTELMQLCHDRQVSVIAIGSNRQQIAELCAEYSVECSVEPGTMGQIVQRAAMEAEKGSVVVLSPAAASFDMFKNYADRGDQFIAAVQAL